MRNVLFIAIALIIVYAVVALYPAARQVTSDGGGGPSRLAGAPAMSFPAKRLDGTPDALANYRGKVVVLNLWASWCPPCVQEMPDLERLQRAYASRGVVVIGVDQGESAKTAQNFARARGVTFRILIDEDQRYGGAYSAVGLPTTMIVDRSGHIVRGVDGALTYAQMQSLVQTALKS